MGIEQKDKVRRGAETAKAGLDAVKEAAGLAADWTSLIKVLVAAMVVGGVAGTVGGVLSGGATGAVVMAFSDPTPAPTVDPVSDMAETASASFAPKLHIESQPSGATIAIDGVAHGVTPADLEPTAGTHRLELRAEAYVPYQLDIELRDGVASQVNVSLRPEAEAEVAEAPPARGGRRPPRRDCGNELSRCRSGCRDSTSYCRDRECGLGDSACQGRCNSMERMCREQCSAQHSACRR